MEEDAIKQEPQIDSQKIPTFSGANNATQTMTKGNILEAIKDFDSSIPDAVVHHFLNVAGMQTTDQRVIKLVAIAAEKFIYDIVSDSLRHCKLRGTKTKEKKYTLTIEDLRSVLAEYGIEVNRPPYFN